MPIDCSFAAAVLSRLCCLQVMIWDDHQKRCIGELSFRSQVWLPAAVVLLEQPWTLAELRLCEDQPKACAHG